MPKLKPIAFSVACALSVAGCAGLQNVAGTAPPNVEPTFGISHGGVTSAALYRLGRFFEGQGRYSQAIFAYREVLKRDPNHVAARNGLGISLAETGNYDEAVSQLQAAIAISADRAYLHNNLGYALLLKGSDEEALRALEQAYRLDPDPERATVHNLRLARERLAAAAKARQTTDVARSFPPTSRSVAINATKHPLQVTETASSGIEIVEVQPSVYELRTSVTAQTLQQAAPVHRSTAVMEGGPSHEAALPLKTFALEISNGNGVSGMAKRVATRLARIGLKVPYLTNQLPFDQANTEIQFREGFRAEAAWLGSTLHASMPVVKNDALRDNVQVRLVLGRDVTNETALFQPDGPATRIAVAKSYRLEISNGNGITGMAQRLAERLERVGVKPVRLTNELPFQQQMTEIQYREGYQAEAAELGASLRVPTSIMKTDALRGDIHVRLVLGKDVPGVDVFVESGSPTVRTAVHGKMRTAH